MKANANCGIVFSMFFLKQPYRVRYQIKAKMRTLQLHSLFVLFNVRRCQN